MIIINDDYRIDSDDNCYTLQERRTAKTGENANVEVLMCTDFYLKEDLRDEHHHCRTGHTAEQ